MNYTADQVVETLGAAADENRMSRLRQGQVIVLPEEGELWMTGDLHDHRRNFEKLIRAADLRTNPQRHLVLHELIHGDHYDADGAEESWSMLYKAADLKADFPEQVHFMMANHDLAQIHGKGIMKAGLSVCEAFNKGVKKTFGDASHVVTAAISDFLLSLPLGIRAPNGIFCCHSLPTDSQIDEFDYTVFERELTGPDYAQKTGPVYQLIWGRNMSPETVEKFAQKMEARLIITGHQPQEMGYTTNGARHLILASDHNQGVFLPIELTRQYEMEDLVRGLRKYVAIDIEVEEA